MRTLITLGSLLTALCALAGCALHPLAQVRLAQGDDALQRRKLDAALEEFRGAIALDPTFAAAHYKLGLVYKEKGDWEQAESALQEAVRLDPKRVEPVFELGEVYRLLNKMTHAIRAYATACSLDPQNFDSRYRLAGCYQQTGEWENAIAAYLEAVRLEPDNAYVRSNLGAAYAAQGKHYEAIKAYKESLECNEIQPIVIVNLATVYLNQGRWSTARATLQKAIQLAPDLSSAHERLGYCCWRENDPKHAEEAYLQAIQLDAKNAPAHAGLGVVLMTQYLDAPERADLRNRAVEAWHNSLELNPNQPKLRDLIEKYRPKPDQPALTIDPALPPGS